MKRLVVSIEDYGIEYEHYTSIDSFVIVNLYGIKHTIETYRHEALLAII